MSFSAVSDLHARLEDRGEYADATATPRITPMSPEAAAGAWRALHEGRWEIVKLERRDGRRFLVARPDAPADAGVHRAAGATGDLRPEQLRQLSAQERRILRELAKGHSNKLIGYDLGLATSTVASLLARAGRKLGCTNRIALARAGRALTEPPAGALDAGVAA
jgi:DNA-binding NarL/FixJ family response regulator